MNKRQVWGGVPWIFVFLTAMALPSWGTPEGLDFQHARVSYDSGGGMVKGKDDADWSFVSVNTLVLPGDHLWIDKEGTLELEMAGGSFFRMADGSKAEVVSVAPGRLRTWTGAFYLQRSSHSPGELDVETPVCLVKTNNDSQVRFDVASNGAATVTVRWGQALVCVEGAEPVAVKSGERSYVDPGYLPSLPEKFNRAEEDAFDAWNRERMRLLANGLDAIPREVRIEDAPMGISDLSRHGEWVRVEEEYCWRPTVVADFVPYRQGHWSFVPGCGYVWVDDYPFCYVTSHYGRWRHHERYGWIWGYRRGWGPAWVATVHYGDNFVWCPLDPFDRPVSFGADFYSVGGLRFGVSVSTYCAAAELLAGPCRVRPCTPVIVRNVPPAQISIWNIRINNVNITNVHRDAGHARGRGFVPYTDHSLAVRDFKPDRVIRGWEHGRGGAEAARMRVTSLEGKEGRTEFAVMKGSDRPAVHTGREPGKMMAQPRSVQLDPVVFEGTRSRGKGGLPGGPKSIGGVMERIQSGPAGESRDGRSRGTALSGEDRGKVGRTDQIPGRATPGVPEPSKGAAEPGGAAVAPDQPGRGPGGSRGWKPNETKTSRKSDAGHADPAPVIIAKPVEGSRGGREIGRGPGAAPGSTVTPSSPQPPATSGTDGPPKVFRTESGSPERRSGPGKAGSSEREGSGTTLRPSIISPRPPEAPGTEGPPKVFRSEGGSLERRSGPGRMESPERGSGFTPRAPETPSPFSPGGKSRGRNSASQTTAPSSPAPVPQPEITRSPVPPRAPIREISPEVRIPKATPRIERSPSPGWSPPGSSGGEGRRGGGMPEIRRFQPSAPGPQVTAPAVRLPQVSSPPVVTPQMGPQRRDEPRGEAPGRGPRRDRDR